MNLESNIPSIKKRNGAVVAFDPNKIETALQKAFLAVRGGGDDALFHALALEVIAEVEARFQEKVPGVEDIQNIVENVLMEHSYFDVAKSYIIYRYRHEKIREVKKQEVEKKLEEGELFVTKRNGTKEPFSVDKLRAAIGSYIKGYEGIIDLEMVAAQCRQEIYEDITTEEIGRAVTMVLRSFIEQDPAYSYAASRSVLFPLYKQVIGREKADFSRIEAQLREAFPNCIRKAVSIGRLDPRMLAFDLEGLARELKFDRDNLHAYLSTQTLTDRYFIRNPETDEILETPQFFWMRVAMGLSLGEIDRDTWTKKFYEEMSTLRYVPSTPTLFHAGTNHPQMSSCYLTTIEDSLDHIFKCIADNAQLSKWSGGIGNDWTNLRGTGSLIRGTGVSSQGTIPFLKIANDTTAAINRSGRRRGATCAYMEVWHWDIEDFLELRKNTGDERRRTHDMDTAAWIPDLFMKRIKEDGDWSLFSPDETAELHHIYGKEFEKKYEIYERRGQAGELKLYRKMKARDLWKKMITMLFETGHPWITWKDPSNVRSPQDHVGVVHSSNLCTEITLNTSSEETAVCNLGSLNLPRLMSGGKLDETMVAHTVELAMRMLDNVVDLNFYPTKEAKTANLKHRPVGLGIMGFQDALYEMGVNFDSEACVDFADKSMEMISYYSILSSSKLAEERGAYVSFRGSKWDRGIFPVDTLDVLEKERGMRIDVPRTTSMNWEVVRAHVREWGMRNSNCMAMAPTATISNIAGSTPTIEPIYKNIYVKANQAGDFTVVNPYLVTELKKRNLWDAEMLGKLKYHDGSIAEIAEIPVELKERYKEVFEVDARWIIKSAAYRGKWVDQSQSLNIFYNGHSGKELSDIYMYAWELGLKTTYYLRSLAISQVEKSTVNTSEYGDTHKRKSVTPPADAVVSAAQSLSPRKEEVPVAPVSMAMPVSQPASVTVPPTIQLCKIDDPSCEACQ